MKIPLSRGLFATIDPDDFPLVSNYVWHAQPSTNGSYYAVTRVPMHRMIMNAPLGVYVDHIDGEGLNNTRDNLRFCNNSQNQHNTASRGGSSRFKGVGWVKARQCWEAKFTLNRKYYFVGYFDSEEEAANAYNVAIAAIVGPFARLNEVE